MQIVLKFQARIISPGTLYCKSIAKTKLEYNGSRVTVRVKGAVNNIFSDELLLLMKERDAAKVKAARTKKVDDWNEFKRLRNKVNNTKLVEKRNY